MTVRLLASGWALGVLGILALAAGHQALPEHIPLYRVPWTGAALLAPRSIVSVGRIAAMGLAQLGATTAMAASARGAEGWERFWGWAAVAAGAKTLAECLGLFAPPATAAERVAFVAAAAPVALFLLAAVRWWRREALRAPPRLHGRPALGLSVALVLWAASAVAPRFVG